MLDLAFRSMRIRATADGIRLLVTVLSLVSAGQAFAGEATTTSSSAPVVSEPPAISDGFKPTVNLGVAGTIVGPLGSSEGGAAIMGRLGWNPSPSLRITVALERMVVPIGKVLCGCAVWPCCVGANAPYTWLGLGVEGHATPRSRVDFYAGAELGAVWRNAGRFAAKGEVGFDVHLAMLAVGPFLGMVVASPDSLFNEESNYTFTFGLRLMVFGEVGPPR